MPALSSLMRVWLISKPFTENFSAKPTATGRPTYPSPITEILREVIAGP